MYVCSEQWLLAHITGYIGERLAVEYLKQVGLDAVPNEHSSRIGDILVCRTWFHDNGYCRGHNQTFGVEVKTTFQRNFQRNLSTRQKKVIRKGGKWKLPLLLIKILDVSKNGIKYDLNEDPKGWTSSKRVGFWRGSPHYYKANAPYKCHKESRCAPVSQLPFERVVAYRRYEYLSSIKYLRRKFKSINYFNLHPLIQGEQSTLEEIKLISKDKL